ncbi:ATPase family associated with various cellular activities (AAA) domain-containing protein [Hirsutella rhossiliensis]|uniref:ATPase family associated with various cellular activities (AAA) domain-containing protein n=1 Tax=Hirsutella rhossiliensis TaxID=111463 RepID=A0A9P8SL48_9HYPO|nr:ATPase family associated with various cellular activities (AAA) domain-containing protein [Hirsutella rhossiliensis]KAH0966586.1 ATPase family associated with various cellular activities (AAA) domain-containing protein [Hirsutella rhossiliensis]
MDVSIQVTSALPGTISIDNTTATDKRISRIDQYYSRKDRQTHFAKTARGDKRTRERLEKHTLVIRRIISYRGIPEGTVVDIKSLKLAAVLQDIFRDADQLMLAPSNKSPELEPTTLFLAWESLEARQAQESARQPPDSQLVDDISIALAYLDQDFGSQRSELRGLLTDGLISYDLLWSIFMPSSAIYGDQNDLGEAQVMKFKHGAYGEDRETGEKFYRVHASLITHDSEVFGWGEKSIRLPLFEGNMAITDLLVFPLDMHPEEKAIRQKLTDRGRSFIKLLEKPTCKWYGTTATRSERVGASWEEVQFLASRRVMIDPPTWMVHSYALDKLRWPLVRNRKSNKLHLSSVKDDDLMFCNHRILGFSFDEKQWGAFTVSKLKDPRWNEAAFDRVVLPGKQLGLIKDLIRSYRTRTDDGDNDDGFDDIIDGKGRGMVGLLSGRPGVGKTLTAEAVVEVSHRPLYSVSAGELGTSAGDVDRQLGKALDITCRWSCVLLIDEAEVFLHKRDDYNLGRNAIVSVFLRRLEYFQGVAILTTNRKLDIDIAFMSRIHYKFHYNDLSSSVRLAVWKNFIGPDISGLGASNEEDGIGQLAEEYALSGREIKNAAFCAKSISRVRNEALSLELIRNTIESLGLAPCPAARKAATQREFVEEQKVSFDYQAHGSG